MHYCTCILTVVGDFYLIVFWFCLNNKNPQWVLINSSTMPMHWKDIQPNYHRIHQVWTDTEVDWTLRTVCKHFLSEQINNLHRVYERLCCVGPGHMEQPPRQTADFITVFSDVCEKTQKSFVRLPAPLKPFVWLVLYKYAYSFIHSIPLSVESGSRRARIIFCVNTQRNPPTTRTFQRPLQLVQRSLHLGGSARVDLRHDDERRNAES